MCSFIRCDTAIFDWDFYRILTEPQFNLIKQQQVMREVYGLPQAATGGEGYRLPPIPLSSMIEKLCLHPLLFT